MNTFVKRITALSALALTSTSWSYPIYPYQEALNRFNAPRSSSIKTNAATENVYIEQGAAKNSTKAAAQNPMVARTSDGSRNTFNSDVTDLGWSSSAMESADHPWYFAKQGRNFEIANFRFWFDAPRDEKAEQRLLKELELNPAGIKSPILVGLNLPEAAVSERGKNASERGRNADKNGAAEKDLTEKDGSEEDRGDVGQVEVSEPSSVALICSGVLGLLLTRRLGQGNRKISER